MKIRFILPLLLLLELRLQGPLQPLDPGPLRTDCLPPRDCRSRTPSGRQLQGRQEVIFVKRKNLEVSPLKHGGIFFHANIAPNSSRCL